MIASFAHIFTNPTSTVPVVGASGAIAAVLGAYLVLYPQSRILTFIPIGYLMRLKLVPAILYWASGSSCSCSTASFHWARSRAAVRRFGPISAVSLPAC